MPNVQNTLYASNSNERLKVFFFLDNLYRQVPHIINACTCCNLGPQTVDKDFVLQYLINVPKVTKMKV